MRRVAICTVLATVALTAAGCGGDDQSPAEAWADDVCTSINTWADTVEQTKETLSDTTNVSVDAVRDGIADVQDATETLVDDLRDLGAPETEAADQAEEEISRLSDELDAQREVVREAIDSGTDSLSELIGTVTTIARAIATMGDTARTAYDSVVNLEGASELRDAFESQESCDQTRSTLSTLSS